MKAKPKTYTSTEPVYVDSRLYARGEPFTTAATKGKTWQETDNADKAATEASSKTTSVQPSMEDLNISPLRALAAEKHVDSTGLKKADLITEIKAADEPAL